MTTAVIAGWTRQELGCSPQDVLNLVREELRTGRFDTAHWDHNSPRYREGRSNKRVKIVGALLLGTTEITMKQAWDAVLTAVLGPKGDSL